MEIALITSLTIVILFVLFYPGIKLSDDKVLYYGEPFITLIDIPTSEQKPSATAPPKPIIPIQFIEVDDDELLPDILIEDTSLDLPVGEKTDPSLNFDPSGAILSNSLPFKPREVYLYVPELDGCDGEIKLSLRIGKDGEVKEHKIIRNSIDSDECEKRIIESMYKWRYMPIIIEGDRFEFWTEKTITL